MYDLEEIDSRRLLPMNLPLYGQKDVRELYEHLCPRTQDSPPLLDATPGSQNPRPGISERISEWAESEILQWGF